VLEEVPDFRPGLEALGQALLKNGEAGRAVSILEKAIRLDPKWPDGHVLLGRAYQAAGRREEAKNEFAIAQKLSNEERKRLEEKVKASKPKQ
jgi:Flp pilus assembly protein TadD